jgi:hypothetical protein
MVKETPYVPPIDDDIPPPADPADYPPGPYPNGDAAVTLNGFNPAHSEGTTAPPRRWIVPKYIPDRTVTLLYADGVGCGTVK